MTEVKREIVRDTDPEPACDMLSDGIIRDSCLENATAEAGRLYSEAL